MKYMGSKSKIARYIVPIIQNEIDENNIQLYWEPFVGGANIIDKVKCPTLIGSDTNYYLIQLLTHLDKLCGLPTSLSREHYNAVRNDYNKNNGIFQPWYIGAIGFLGSFGGRFFDGGYAAPVHERDFYNEARQNLIKQAENLQAVEFKYGAYDSLFGSVKNATIYCDPPYRGTKNYTASNNFSHEAFWNWCRKMSKNNIVLVSEQNAPEDFECIWEHEVTRTTNIHNDKKATEKLFKLKQFNYITAK